MFCVCVCERERESRERERESREREREKREIIFEFFFSTPTDLLESPAKKKIKNFKKIKKLLPPHPARKSADVAPCDSPLSHPSAVPGPTDSSHSASTESTVCLWVRET